MGIEGGYNSRPALVEAALHRSSDHRLVAEVETVEIAECDDGPAQAFGDAAGEGQALHRAAALVGRKVLPQQSVFVDGKSDHEQVEDAQGDERDLVRVGVAVKLVGDERAEDG